LSYTTDLERRVAAGWELFRGGREEEAIESFRQLVEEYPDDPRAHFELGSVFDAAGREDEAIQPYRRSLERGLRRDNIPRALLQLGSSLRNVGAYEEAVRTLSEGRGRFPDYVPVRFFLALALYDAGRHREALVESLELALSGPDRAEMQEYARAMRSYLDALRTG
jgi:tetratricopeptide (TPR) repeat protein